MPVAESTAAAAHQAAAAFQRRSMTPTVAADSSIDVSSVSGDLTVRLPGTAGQKDEHAARRRAVLDGDLKPELTLRAALVVERHRQVRAREPRGVGAPLRVRETRDARACAPREQGNHEREQECAAHCRSRRPTTRLS